MKFAMPRQAYVWRFLLAAILVWQSCVPTYAATWSVSRRIPVGRDIVRIIHDPARPWIYAIDRQNSDVLFISLKTGQVEKVLYVGQDPTDCDIDASGDILYVANKGPGSGVPGSWRIGVVTLTNQSLQRSIITSALAHNVTVGRPGRLFYNSGIEGWNWGDVHAVDTEADTDLGSFGVIKTRMVISGDKTKLYGQYTYSGNLGAMGRFDVATDQINLVDSLGYSPYPYGWDYDNYSISADSTRLAYGKILFNANVFADQIGVFPEQIHALNSDGSIAFGANSVWDTTTFTNHGNATRIVELPFSTTVMTFDPATRILYAFDPIADTLCAVEQTTTAGIPVLWLAQYGLPTADEMEAQDPDNDGLNNLEEWRLGGNPTNAALPIVVPQDGLRFECGTTAIAEFQFTAVEATHFTVVWSANEVPTQTNVVTLAVSATTNLTFATDALLLGTNAVSVAVFASTSNSTNCAATVVIADTTPPTVQFPTDVLLLNCEENGQSLSFLVSATDVCSEPVTTSIDGSLFYPIGTNAVVCLVTDRIGNSTQATFTVTLLGVRDTQLRTVSEIENAPKIVPAFRSAAVHLSRAADAALWRGATLLSHSEGLKVFSELQTTVRRLSPTIKPLEESIDVRYWIARVVFGARTMAQSEITAAISADLPQQVLEKAAAKVAAGDEADARGKHLRAVQLYRDAWRIAAHKRK